MDLEAQPMASRIEGFLVVPITGALQENESMKSYYVLTTANKP